MVPQLEALIKEQGLSEQLELRGAFCLAHCECGRSLRVGDYVVTGLSPENIAQRFATDVVPHLPRA